MNPLIAPILNALRVLHEPDTLVEVRGLAVDGNQCWAGRFLDPVAAANAALRLSGRSKGVYVTLNPIMPELGELGLDRARVDQQAADRHIQRRRWMLVDIEAQRPNKARSNASDQEVEQTRAQADQIITDLVAAGWPAPVLVMSGNGWHLLYRIDLPANDGGLVRKCLRALAARYPNVDIDATVHNPSRITKLPGTLARKAPESEGRPYRLADLVAEPRPTLQVPVALLELLAAEAPQEAPPTPVPLPRPQEPQEGRPEAFERARAWMAKRDPAIEGQRGDNHTLATACRLVRGYSLPDEDALSLLIEWNQTCVPPWTEAELRRKIANAHKSGSEAYGSALAEDSATWRLGLKQAADRAGVSQDVIRRAIRAGKLRAEQVETKWGPSYQVAEPDLRAWLTQSPGGPLAQSPGATPRTPGGPLAPGVETDENDPKTPGDPWRSTPGATPQTPGGPLAPGVKTDENNPGARGLSAKDSPPKASNKKLTEDTSEDLEAVLPKVTAGPDIPRVARESMAALAERNEQRLQVLKRGDVICRYEVTDKNEPKLRPCSESMLRGMLARSATFWQKRQKDGEWTTFQVKPDPDVVKDILALDPIKWPFPSVTRIVRRPVLTPDGEVIATEGYHERAQVLYKPLTDWTMPQVPDSPTEHDLAEARGLLAEALHDFPFVDQASRAHALAAALQPTARCFISGPTPLWLFDASTPGSGKTLLAEVLLLIGSGCTPAKLSAPRNDNHDEWQKKITSTLMDAPDAILLDNLSKRLDCPAMADVLTAVYWDDRLLGSSKSVHLDNLGQWVATANNLELSDELARRTILCRLDANTARPEERTGFLHEPLKPWVESNLGRLTWATLVMVKAWFQRGMPTWAPEPGAKRVGSYESWCNVLGGILQVAGVSGFLTNREATQHRSGGIEQEWIEFFRFWYQKFGCAPVRVKEILPDVLREQLLTGIIKTDKDRAMAVALGTALRGRVDRIQAGLKLHLAGYHRTGVQLFKLEVIDINAVEGREPAPAPPEPVQYTLRMEDIPL